MSLNNTDIFQLANVLRQNGDKVLNAISKLSLNAVFLQKLNKEFEILLENIENGEGSFEVTTFYGGNSQLLEDLLFLHDFVQKTVGLKLTNSANFSLLKSKIDISKFKNIKYLEIKKVPIKEVVGLKSIQSQLESIVCVRCLSKLEELLASCGGDNSSGFVWSELREAVLTFNDIKVVDTSIAFAPWLQVLDLSHNQISDAKAVECLPNLKYVNLSFNCLDVIPTFNRSARKKIELLVLKNNYIEDLTGLNGLCHLIELDLSNNWVSSSSSLNPLLSIATLQWLSLAGNPISCHQNYRRSVAGYLHINASFGAFYLDKIILSKKEKSIVSINLSGDDTPSGKPQIQRVSRHSLKSKSSCDESSTGDQVSTNVRKSGKPRVVVIPNLDDGTYEEVPDEFNNSDLMNSSTEHLITKKRIENARSTFGVDNWLVQGSSVVQDILGLPPVQVTSSTPYSDLCAHIALDSTKNVVTTTAVIETQPESEGESFDKNYSDPFFTCNESSSNYNSIETSAEKTDEITNKTEEIEKYDNLEKPEPFSKEVSPDIEKIQEEEIEINENEKLFVVSREIKTINNEIKHEELFLTITETELQEREPTRGKIITKWSLSLLESCVKLKPNQLHLVFDIVRRDKRERTYSLEEEEANLLYKQIAELLESRTLSDMHQIVFKCENCSSQFSKEVKSNKSDRNKWCPFCNSKLILQLDEVSLPHSVEEKKSGGVKDSKNDPKVSHNRSSSVGGFFQSLLGQNENKILKCSSQSSIDYIPSQCNEIIKSSAASLDELNELPNIQSTAVKRSDSDIEILSNPSQSSIEVIDGPGRGLTGNTPHRRRSSEEKQFVPPAAVAAAANLLQGGNPAGLTESSSSGSVTDSICTAYETSSAIPTIINKTESETTILENSEEFEKDTLNNSESILQEVLKKVRIELKENKPAGIIKYSYSDFTNIDHRIKLFLYTHIFEDSTEDFFFGLRAFVEPLNNTDNAFPSCIIASNKKLYFLKVTNIEHGDDARSFLQKVDSHSFNLHTVKCIYTLTWYQGFGVKIQASKKNVKQYLILLRDSSRTKNFLEFLLSSDTQNFKNIKIITEPLERSYMAMQHLLLSLTSLDDSNIQYFCLFDSSSVSDYDGTKVIPSGGLLINNVELLLFGGNLHWLADGVEQPQNPEFSQKFRNLVQVYSKETIILLHFIDGSKEKEVWEIKMETSDAAEALLNSVKELWEKLFSIPLQLSSI